MAEKPDFGKVIADYRRNMKEDLFALWKIWVPATALNFAFMPMHLRIPFVAGVSLLWTAVRPSILYLRLCLLPNSHSSSTFILPPHHRYYQL